MEKNEHPEQEIITLLNSINDIVDKYKKISIITGENFNIYSVLKLESDEVRLHSRLIGELLNPKGSHGQNELFLKLFISTMGLENQYQNDDLKKAKVLVEENIGGIPEDYSKGGRIDIVIKFPDTKPEIVIENKIYAPDQKNQLGRYYAEYPNAHIVYLTRLEKEPSNDSLGTFLKLADVKCRTYKKHIYNWLEHCINSVTDKPLIKESLVQYLNLIKKLTQQTTNHKMTEELVKLICSDPQFIKNAYEVHNVWKACEINILKKLGEKISLWGRDPQISLEFKEEEESNTDSYSFWLYKNEWRFCIWIVFESCFERMIIRVDHLDYENKYNDEDTLKKFLKDFNPGEQNKNTEYIWESDFSVWENTKWEEVLEKIPMEIEKIVTDLVKKIQDFNP